MLIGGALAGCGSSTSLPGGHTISVPGSVPVPAVTMPGLPGIDLRKTDPASAQRAICRATDLWLTANDETKKVVRPTVDTVINTYKESADPAIRDLAAAAQELVTVDSRSEQTKRASWNRLCGTT